MTSSESSFSKYLRVFPIFGLLLYYLGGLVASIEAASIIMFIAWLILFSLIELVGLYLLRKEAIILGAILLMLFSFGPMMALAEGVFSMIAFGGLIMAIGIVFHLLTIYVWIKN